MVPMMVPQQHYPNHAQTWTHGMSLPQGWHGQMQGMQGMQQHSQMQVCVAFTVQLLKAETTNENCFCKQLDFHQCVFTKTEKRCFDLTVLVFIFCDTGENLTLYGKGCFGPKVLYLSIYILIIRHQFGILTLTLSSISNTPRSLLK